MVRLFLATLCLLASVAVSALPFGYVTFGGAGSDVLAAFLPGPLPEGFATPPDSRGGAQIGVPYPFVFADCERPGEGPIDFDGSYWDAAPDRSADLDRRGAYGVVATIELTGRNQAVLTFADSMSVPLGRSAGPKFFASCYGITLFTRSEGGAHPAAMARP